jgi:hypothetical protein
MFEKKYFKQPFLQEFLLLGNICYPKIIRTQKELEQEDQEEFYQILAELREFPQSPLLGKDFFQQ